MAAFISEDFFVGQFRLISQHLVGFHPSAIEHAGHVRIAIVLLFSLWSQVTKDTRIITSKSCEWCQDLVQASPWYQGHGRTKMKVSIAYAAGNLSTRMRRTLDMSNSWVAPTCDSPSPSMFAR